VRAPETRLKISRAPVPHGVANGSGGTTKPNRPHRFVRFAPRNARQNAFSGGSPQKNFALVNPFLHVFSRLRRRVDAGLLAARVRQNSK
jgi:hypothetical protein